MEVVLRKSYEIETELFHMLQQPRAIGQPLLIIVGVLPGEPAFELLRRGASAGQKKGAESEFHPIAP